MRQRDREGGERSEKETVDEELRGCQRSDYG